MEIVIPTEHSYGQEVELFLASELTEIQRDHVLEKLEMYEKFSFFDLRRTEKIKEIDGYKYLRVSVGNIRLRIFGVLRENEFMIVYICKKKRRTLPVRDLEKAKNRVDSFRW